MGKDRLLKSLPPYQGNNLLISKQQSVRDIVNEVTKSHVAFARHYDQIAGQYLRSSLIDVCRGLFYDCKEFAPYYEEPDKMQTTRSPAAFLEVSDYIGADCKHYAGYIAGVLDALSRMLRRPIDWCYRFAAYRGKKEFGHVFVVVNPGTADEIWIDPVLPVFNQHYPVPTKFEDKKIVMSLNRISGIGNAGYNSTVTVYRGGRTMGAVDTQSLSVQALDAVQPGLGQGVATVIDHLPSTGPLGGIKSFLEDFLSDPGGALTTLIKGRTYTSGDYALGEMYMRNILGYTQIQSRGQVPDSSVPPAWLFFSAALGVRIHSDDDIHTLYNAIQDGGGAQAYLDRDPRTSGDMSLAAAQRARDVLTYIGIPRDSSWPPESFKITPYIYPIPSPVLGVNFDGIHPILKTRFVNGYPVDYTGARYKSQVSQELQAATTTTAPTGTGTGTGTGTNTGGGKTQTASFLSGNAVPLLLGGGLLLIAANSGKKKPRGKMGAVTRKKKDDHTALLLLIGIGVAGVALSKKKPAATAPATQLPSTIPINTGLPMSVAPGIAQDSAPIYSPPNPGYVPPDQTLVKPAGGGQVYINTGIDYMPTDKSYPGAQLAPDSQTEYVNFT